MKTLSLLLGACLCAAPPLVAQAQPAAENAQAKRERDLKMPEIIQALGLKAGSRVADIGAGDGYYDIPISRAVGSEGRIYGEDISEGALKRLREHVTDQHLARQHRGDPWRRR